MIPVNFMLLDLKSHVLGFPARYIRAALSSNDINLKIAGDFYKTDNKRIIKI